MNTADIDELYPFKSNYYVVKGYKYHYLDEGQGAPMVMVHGNPTWSFFYRRLIKEFSRTHRVIVPDHLGCGLSDKPQNFEYRLETHIENLESLIVALKIDAITLVVHDWGGAIGMGFAVRHPHRIKSLIILNSGAFSMDVMPWPIWLCRLPWLGEVMVRKFNLFARG
ncbi:MAG: alpha/beta fold hydrolase, partial [Victivallales bacterium]|nr:alpha/beta fold hydrolase [Victivallales bacterium]